MLGTKPAFTVSPHWANSTLSQEHTNSLLASDIWRESTKCFWSPRHLLSTQRASVISVTVVSSPRLSFQGPLLWSSPTHFPLCSSNFHCLKAMSPQKPFWIWGKKGSFMVLCLQGHLHSGFTGVQPGFSVTYNNYFWGSPTIKPCELHADQPPNNTLGSSPYAD